MTGVPAWSNLSITSRHRAGNRGHNMTTLIIDDGSPALRAEMQRPVPWVRRQERTTPKPTAEELRERWRRLLREAGVGR